MCQEQNSTSCFPFLWMWPSKPHKTRQMNTILYHYYYKRLNKIDIPLFLKVASRSFTLLSFTLFITVHLNSVLADNLKASLYIWCANSLVGQSTRALGPPWGAPRRWNKGRRKAAVLPEPVGAVATIWRPCWLF